MYLLKTGTYILNILVYTSLAENDIQSCPLQLQSSDIGENIMRESIKLSWGGGGG